MIKKITVFILKWLIGIAIIAFLIVHIETSKIGSVMAGADTKYLAAGFLIAVIIRVFYAWQTALAIKHQDVFLGIVRALVVNTISGFYSLFLPGGVSGGVIKWYKLSKATGKRTEVLAAIIYLRFLNAMIIVAFGIIGLLIENPLDSRVLFRTSIFSLVLLAGLYLLFFSNRLKWFYREGNKQRLSFFPTPIQEILAKLSHSLLQYRSLPRREFLIILIIPLMNLILTVLLFHMIGRSLDISISVYALLWIVAMVYLIQMVPVIISGLGLRESALVLVLPHYGVEPATAMVFSLSIFGFLLIMGLIGGVLEIGEHIHI